jgi:hypothetical protein
MILLIYFYFYSYCSIKHSPSWEGDSCSASQNIPSHVCNKMVQYRVHKSLPLDPILSQIKPLPALKPYQDTLYMMQEQISTATILHSGRSRNQASIPARETNLSLLYRPQNGCEILPASYLMRNGVLSPGVKTATDFHLVKRLTVYWISGYNSGDHEKYEASGQ